MTPLEWVGVFTLILTFLGAVIRITERIATTEHRVKEERLKAEKESLEHQYRDLEAQYHNLQGELALARKIGTVALHIKTEVDELLTETMRDMRAGAGSVYIPLSSNKRRQQAGLVFLSIQPFGENASKLKKKIIPINSKAGQCFKSGEPEVAASVKADPDHFKGADRVSGYKTEDMLNYPLKFQGETVGVIQLLNKEGTESFVKADLLRLETYADSIAVKTAEFINNPEHFEILGITPDRDLEFATVMFCDLTNSSRLFQDMNASTAIQNINEYLERMCEIAFEHGATVDKYMGDGVLFRFNVPRTLENHPLQAVKSAVQMRSEFEMLKNEWNAMAGLTTNVHNRIAIAYGQVHQVMIGHPQYRYQTILGSPVHVAVHLCEAATRDRDIIVIDENLKNALSGRIITNQVKREFLGKASTFISEAYELEGLR